MAACVIICHMLAAIAMSTAGNAPGHSGIGGWAGSAGRVPLAASPCRGAAAGGLALLA